MFNLINFKRAYIDSLLIKRIKSEIKFIKEDKTHIRMDVRTIINFVDKEYLEPRKRVERLGNHLRLPSVY